MGGPHGKGQGNGGRGRGVGGSRGGGRRGGDGRGGGRGGAAWGRKRSGSGGGEDVRWRKAKKAKKERRDEGDAAVADAVVIRAGDLPPGAGAFAGADAASGVPEKTEGEPEKTEGVATCADARKAFQKEKMAAVKEKRRRKFEEERAAADTLMRSDPAAFLWTQFCQWAGPDKLTALERDSEQWSSENVSFLPVAESSDGESGALISAIKRAVPDAYARVAEPRDGVPGVCVLLVAASGLRAAQLGRAMYDGKPVGKLFSKHIKNEEQRKWLRSNGMKKAAPTGVATARRLHLLCDEGSLSLASTSVFVIDMSRDQKMRTVLDMTATRDELCDFINVHLRPLVRAGQVKLLLHTSQ